MGKGLNKDGSNQYSGIGMENLAYLEGLSQPASSEETPPPGGGGKEASSKQGRLNALLWGYRDVGYIFADLNPLGDYITTELKYLFSTMRGSVESLEPEAFGFSEEDMDREFRPGRFFPEESLPLRKIIQRLKLIYRGPLGAEILHIQNRSMRNWLIANMEDTAQGLSFSPSLKTEILRDLIRAETFEKFVNNRFIGQKRFSLEGGEAVIPALKYFFRKAIDLGIREVFIGMAHRGRLNVLTNAISKPADEIFAMFQDNYRPHVYGGSGDVKYHAGQSCDFFDEEGRSLHISLVANPSHLEAVNGVVEGKTRGIQRLRGDRNRKKIVPLLIHGDAAFSGQGVVYETLNLSQLKGYRTGGTVHVILNNQIGFTTSSRDSRSTFFATDIAKALPIPIFHANGDHPESVIKAVDFALRWRHKFGYDAVVDIICYRRLGHNEADEPSFTHPIMYAKIKNHPPVTTLYGEVLDGEGIFPRDRQGAFKKDFMVELDRALEKAKDFQDYRWNSGYQKGEWKGMGREYFFDFPHTGVGREKLRKIGRVLSEVPEGFRPHSKLLRFVKERKKAMELGKGIDWSFAESLAFGSLLKEGYHVRLSGEDSSRGTFSQRHALWWDVSTDTPRSYAPLNSLGGETGEFSVFDSPLSEFAVLGFEYGYSLAMPRVLVLWEAQFGDFANGAQTVIDQFISSGEKKWFRSSGLVMLLPHGYEGQGPEHSNAYLERYLSLCAEENLQVCNPTTPAQYFHLLRKQMLQMFRKPLIIMAPKSLLRHRGAVSTLAEMEKGKFQTVLEDPLADGKVERVILCSGKVYYDLAERRTPDTALIRLEQLYPFPEERLNEVFTSHGKAGEFLWVQEEPRNRGAWQFLRPLLEGVTDQPWRYLGRPASASASSGAYEKNEAEKEEFLRQAFPDYHKEET